MFCFLVLTWFRWVPQKHCIYLRSSLTVFHVHVAIIEAELGFSLNPGEVLKISIGKGLMEMTYCLFMSVWLIWAEACHEIQLVGLVFKTLVLKVLFAKVYF